MRLLRFMMAGLAAALFFPACHDGGTSATTVYDYRVLNAYPHDQEAYTQGLVYDRGFLYEGTGLYGHSTLRRVELETGSVLQSTALSDRYFGEGVTVFDDTLIQLTWKAREGFVYHRETFRLAGSFSYPHEGWGLTHDGALLVVSDGTPTLRFLDPVRFEEVRRVIVHDGASMVDDLNELEYIRGRLYANVWKTDRIAIIDPADGRVDAWLDLTGLRELNRQNAGTAGEVLNGIAFDRTGGRLFVTGKRWPLLYEIEMVAR